MKFIKVIIYDQIYEVTRKTRVIFIQKILDILKKCFFYKIELAVSEFYPVSVMLICLQSAEYMIHDKFINWVTDEIKRLISFHNMFQFRKDLLFTHLLLKCY